MNRANEIARLKELAALARDDRLTHLREAARRREQSLMQIAALERDGQDVDLAPVAAGLVALRYQAWADVRRSELNVVLARQTADWLSARDEARIAFGRCEALHGVMQRLGPKR